MEQKDPEHHQTTTGTTTLLLRPATTTCNDLVLISASSTESMETTTPRRNTEEREFEKERKRVRYVSAGLSAIFTFLFVVVLVSTIGLNWWYSLVICGVPAMVGGLLLLRHYSKETERRRLEVDADLAAAISAPMMVMPQFSALYYEQMMQQYHGVQPCTHCQHCEHNPSANNAGLPENSPTNVTNSVAPSTMYPGNNLPPPYSLLYPREDNSLPAAT